MRLPVFTHNVRLSPILWVNRQYSALSMHFANHRPRIVPVMHNNLMNRSRRSRILYRSPFPKSRHIVTVSTALPRAFLPDSVSLALEDPPACCASPHERMVTCRHAAMPATAPLPSFRRRPDAAGEGDPSRKPGPVFRIVPLWSAQCRAMLRNPGNLTCNEVTVPSQPNHPFTIIAQPPPLQAEAFQGQVLSQAR